MCLSTVFYPQETIEAPSYRLASMPHSSTHASSGSTGMANHSVISYDRGGAGDIEAASDCVGPGESSFYDGKEAVDGEHKAERE